MGYKFQFITLAGFHQLNFGMFELARGYQDRQMAAYSELQQAEFAAEAERVHRDQASARGRHRLFRRGLDGDHGRQLVDHRHERIRPSTSSSCPRRNARRHGLRPEEGTKGIGKRRRCHGTLNRLKQRAEERSSAMSIDQQAAIRMVANDLHRLNQAVMKAVEAGVSVELVRSAATMAATAIGAIC